MTSIVYKITTTTNSLMFYFFQPGDIKTLQQSPILEKQLRRWAFRVVNSSKIEEACT